MPRNWTVLLLVIGTIASAPSFAQPQTSHRCNLDRIRAAFGSSERFPSLVGCRPNDVRPILQNQDYGLTVENRVASETMREGRIVSQRVQSSNVYVDVSTGPDRERQLSQLFEGLVGIVSSLPPPNPQPPEPEPFREPAPPAPNPDLERVIAVPPVVQPAPPPSAVRPGSPPDTQPTSPPAIVQPAPPPPATAPAPAPADTQSGQTAEEKVAQAPQQPQPEKIGAESQPAAPSEPQDTAPTPAPTAASQPIATEVTPPTDPPPPVLDRWPWWRKLLQAVASLPIWAAALAAAAAVASLVTIFVPRATCSIGQGSVDLGTPPLKSRWPAMRVDTAIGDASFSIPSPLPIGRRSDAEPSPA